MKQNMEKLLEQNQIMMALNTDLKVRAILINCVELGDLIANSTLQKVRRMLLT